MPYLQSAMFAAVGIFFLASIWNDLRRGIVVAGYKWRFDRRTQPLRYWIFIGLYGAMALIALVVGSLLLAGRLPHKAGQVAT